MTRPRPLRNPRCKAVGNDPVLSVIGHEALGTNFLFPDDRILLLEPDVDLFHLLGFDEE